MEVVRGDIRKNPHQQGSYRSSRRHVRMPRKRPLSAHAVHSEHGRAESSDATKPLHAVIRMPKPPSAKPQHRDSHGKPLQPHVVIRKGSMPLATMVENTCSSLWTTRDEPGTLRAYQAGKG